MAKLYFRYGAMGSSKSANILMVHHNYKERGQYAVLLKPRIDNRDGEHKIASRIGLSAPADYVEDFLKEVSKTWRIKEGDRKEYTRCEKKNEVDKKYLYHFKALLVQFYRSGNDTKIIEFMKKKCVKHVAEEYANLK